MWEISAVVIILSPISFICGVSLFSAWVCLSCRHACVSLFASMSTRYVCIYTSYYPTRARVFMSTRERHTREKWRGRNKRVRLSCRHENNSSCRIIRPWARHECVSLVDMRVSLFSQELLFFGWSYYPRAICTVCKGQSTYWNKATEYIFKWQSRYPNDRMHIQTTKLRSNAQYIFKWHGTSCFSNGRIAQAQCVLCARDRVHIEYKWQSTHLNYRVHIQITE